MIIKLRGSLKELNVNIEKFDKSNRRAANILIWLTTILVILTLLVSWLTYALVVRTSV